MKRVDADGDFERSRHMVIGEIVARNARMLPDVTALIFRDQSLTFLQLNRRVNQLAAALARRGIRHGSRVAVLMYNRLEVIESYLACHKLGACPVPINFRLVAEEVTFLLQHSQSSGIITEGALEHLLVDVDLGSELFRITVSDDGLANGVDYERALAEESATEPNNVVDEQDLAFLMYTSGTTGRPKGAMLTHRNLVSNTANWIMEMRAGRDDVWLSGLPLFHIGGINGFLPFLYLGATSIVTESMGFDAHEALDLMVQRRVTMCYFVPTQWRQICALPEAMQTDTSRLRLALWGGSQAPLSLLEQLVKTFPSLGIVNAFGQTEMSSNTCFLHPEDAVRKMGSVGRPAINVECRVVDDEMKDVATGEVGEIVYRGPTVMRGYYRDEEATIAAFSGGWFHSGDLVRVDDEGFITVVDRKKDVIISGGENIYPAEVERVLEQHPGVAEVAVVGVPDPIWVETPVAFVVALGQQPPAEELIAYVKSRLASYKKPSSVIYVDALPRNAAGKVLRRELQSRMGAMARGETK